MEKKCFSCNESEGVALQFVVESNNDSLHLPRGLVKVSICKNCLNDLANRLHVKKPIFGLNLSNMDTVLAQCLNLEYSKGKMPSNIETMTFDKKLIDDIVIFSTNMADIITSKIYATNNDETKKPQSFGIGGIAGGIADAYANAQNKAMLATKSDEYVEMEKKYVHVMEQVKSSSKSGNIWSNENICFTPLKQYKNIINKVQKIGPYMLGAITFWSS